MVTTDALIGLYQHYDDQANTPFTGAARARRIADRLYIVLNKTNKAKLLRALPKNASDTVEEINQMTDEQFEWFVETADLSGFHTKIEKNKGSCETEPDEPRFTLRVEYDRNNDFMSERWNVYLTREYGGSSITKTVAAYAYQNSAETLVRVLPNDQEVLKVLWTNL